MSTRARPEPRNDSAAWPHEICRDPVSEKARLFAMNLRAAMGSRTLHDVEATTGVDSTILSRILGGHVWPDGYTIARLEVRLHPHLWPDPDS